MDQGMVILSCAHCTLKFGITPEYHKQRKADHKHFRCPEGCLNYFPGKMVIDREKERMRAEVIALKIRILSLQDQLDAQSGVRQITLEDMGFGDATAV